MVTEGELVAASTEFEQALGGGDRDALRGVCDAKSAELPGEEGETWSFLRIHFSEPDPRRCVLDTYQPAACPVLCTFTLVPS